MENSKICELKVQRFKYTSDSTISEFYLQGTLFGYTLEPFDRGLDDSMSLEEIEKTKVPGSTAIPTGTYPVTLYNSPDHGMTLVPLLHNVKGFEFVEIHIGNFPKNTKACLLIGSAFKQDIVINSKDTFEELMKILNRYSTFSITVSRK